MLIQMLQEYLPPPYTPVGKVGPDWFEVQHLHLASLLGGWGDRMLISPLRETLARLWQVEQNAPDNINQTGMQLWWGYQDELAYALGQLGAFDALTGLEVSADRLRVWTVNLALGYLNMQQRYQTNCIGFIGDPMHVEDYQELSPLLLQVLQQQIGLSLQEAISFLRGYGEDCFHRWDSFEQGQEQSVEVMSKYQEGQPHISPLNEPE